MIHSTRLTQFRQYVYVKHCVASLCFVLLDFEKWGRTEVRTTREKTVITTGRDWGSAA